MVRERCWWCSALPEWLVVASAVTTFPPSQAHSHLRRNAPSLLPSLSLAPGILREDARARHTFLFADGRPAQALRSSTPPRKAKPTCQRWLACIVQDEQMRSSHRGLDPFSRLSSSLSFFYSIHRWSIAAPSLIICTPQHPEPLARRRLLV